MSIKEKLQHITLAYTAFHKQQEHETKKKKNKWTVSIAASRLCKWNTKVILKSVAINVNKTQTALPHSQGNINQALIWICKIKTVTGWFARLMVKAWKDTRRQGHLISTRPIIDFMQQSSVLCIFEVYKGRWHLLLYRVLMRASGFFLNNIST